MTVVDKGGADVEVTEVKVEVDNDCVVEKDDDGSVDKVSENVEIEEVKLVSKRMDLNKGKLILNVTYEVDVETCSVEVNEVEVEDVTGSEATRFDSVSALPNTEGETYKQKFD